MTTTEKLRNLETIHLLDAVKNYKKYGYDEEVRLAAISILNERDYSTDRLSLLGYLNNNDYDEAVKQYNAFRRNSKIAICVLFLSLGTLSIVYIIMLYMAHNNQNRFYKALGKENNNTFIVDVMGILLYFHVRDKMRAELKS